MRKILFGSFYIKQGMVPCPAIPDYRRFADMTIRVEEYISVDILNPYPHGPQNRLEIVLTSKRTVHNCTVQYRTVGVSTINVVR